MRFKFLWLSELGGSREILFHLVAIMHIGSAYIIPQNIQLHIFGIVRIQLSLALEVLIPIFILKLN